MYNSSATPCIYLLVFKLIKQIIKEVNTDRLLIMSSSIKQKIAKNVYHALHNKFYIRHFEDLFGWFRLMRNDENKIVWRIDLPVADDNKLDSSLLVNSQSELLESEAIKHINTYYSGKEYEIELELKQFMKDILESNPTELNYKPFAQKVLVEFSSPNIAKPFHLGHLRSTIIGNCIANVKAKLGKDIVKMNYLGDWGTQFGMIQVGMSIENYTEEVIEKDPIKKMYEAYVTGNREAEVNPEIFEKARKVFSDLESGEEEITHCWEKYKNWTIQELSATYERLGVVFDKYEWESDYNRKEVEVVLKMLQEKGVLSTDEKGRVTAVVGDTVMPLLKSDNTTLYLLRDLAAAFKRRTKYKFDELHYVVENGQSKHFMSLFSLCKELNLEEGVTMNHVKFGRIHGMSTRKGKVVFLADILEEAQERCYQQQMNTKTTKISLDGRREADVLGISAVIVNDLKMHRKKDYEFSWEKILQLKGETGIQLQYCHCRLHSLERVCGTPPTSECDPEALLEPEAINLILEIAKFEETLWHSDRVLEPCILVAYLFRLVKALNAALKVLPVKNSDPHTAGQRLLLFSKGKQVLHEGMKLLGLNPLTEM